jgi:hypothetical protein
MELVLPSLRTTNYNIDSNVEERSSELEFVDEQPHISDKQPNHFQNETDYNIINDE